MYTDMYIFKISFLVLRVRMSGALPPFLHMS